MRDGTSHSLYNITKAGPPDGPGTKWLVAPKPHAAEPSVLYHRNPWLEPSETHASDSKVALAKFSGIWDFVKNLLLHTSPRSFARSGPNQCRKILWSLTVRPDRKKSGNFDSAWRRQAETYGLGEAGSARTAIALGRNETISPKPVHPCTGSVWGQARKDAVNGHLVAL